MQPFILPAATQGENATFTRKASLQRNIHATFARKPHTRAPAVAECAAASLEKYARPQFDRLTGRSLTLTDRPPHASSTGTSYHINTKKKLTRTKTHRQTKRAGCTNFEAHLHDVGEGGVARFVEAEVCGDDGGQRHGQHLCARVRFSLHFKLLAVVPYGQLSPGTAHRCEYGGDIHVGLWCQGDALNKYYVGVSEGDV